ncbi:MAG: hypothetical protein Q4G02_00005 [bacterium]|nr:hypothetical protein [bacterium]
MELSSYLVDYLRANQKAYDYQHQPIVNSFEIDDLALQVGKFYEKIRKVVDWKEENALRRGSITRALKRNLVGQFYGFAQTYTKEQNKQVSQVIVFELMRSGYFNNQLINTQKVDEVAAIIFKYAVILQEIHKKKSNSANRKDAKEKIKFQTWILQIASCELEACLAPNYKTQALVQLMCSAMKQRIKLLPKNFITEEQVQKYILIAVWRALFEADDYFVAYQLITAEFPQLTKNQTINENNDYEAFFKAKQQIFKELNTKVGRSFLSLANKYDAAYRLIGDINKEFNCESVADGEKAWQDEEKVEKLFNEIYDRRYKSLKKRLLRTSLWSTLSILAANAFSVAAIEGPVAALMGLDFTWFSIAMDILIPSVAMFFLVIIIRPPPAENKAVLWQEVQKVFRAQKTDDVYEIRQRGKTKNRVLQTFFYATTLIAGAVGLWAMYKAFEISGLPWTSIYLNVVYLTMVLFASLNIRHKSTELTVYEKSSFFDFILDIFSIPLARIGQWFSKKWKEYNVFSVFFSLLVDAPLSLFISFIEDWRDFLKEKKAEIR